MLDLPKSFGTTLGTYPQYSRDTCSFHIVKGFNFEQNISLPRLNAKAQTRFLDRFKAFWASSRWLLCIWNLFAFSSISSISFKETSKNLPYQMQQVQHNLKVRENNYLTWKSSLGLFTIVLDLPKSFGTTFGTYFNIETIFLVPRKT